MKRRALERWLAAHDCELVREGARHSWFVNTADDLVRKICRDLGIDAPAGT